MRPAAALRTAAVAALLTAPAAAGEPFAGPFELNDGITFYLVQAADGPLKATVRYRDARRRDMPRPCLLRLFDANERLVARHEFAGEPLPGGADVPWVRHTFAIPAAGAGIWQLRVSAWAGGRVDLAVEPNLPFGVHGHIQWLCGRRGQFDGSFLYLPPGLDRLPVDASARPCGLRLLDERGEARLELTAKEPRGAADLPADGEHVWRLRLDGACKLDFSGLPIILCPDERTARAIRASVEVLDDGTICFHRFQRRAWELLARYRRMPASAFEVPVDPLGERMDAWMARPVRNSLLLGRYGLMAIFPSVLSEQNLDAASPWFGSIAAWKDRRTLRARKDNPLAHYDRLGLKASAGLGKDLAALHWLDEPVNPYRGNEALLRRVILSGLQNLMYIGEGEHLAALNSYYYGSHGFPLVHDHTGAFALAAPACPPEVRAVWTDGLRRLVDRMALCQVGGCTNQWAHFPEALERFHQGTGEAWYRRAALRHLHWIATGAMFGAGQRPAGYMTEATGPDATYNGLMAHFAANVCRRTGSAEAREMLRRCYRLFHHTIAPEPDGRWVGASSFCCRTPGDWTNPQYGGGLAIMADVLAQAGLREGRAWVFPRLARTPEQQRDARRELRKQLHYYPHDSLRAEPANLARAGGAFDIWLPVFLHWPREPKTEPLPCRQGGRWQRDFGGEFFCIRREGYYAMIYAGQAMAEWLRPRRPEGPNHQYPHNDGGICLLWSEAFGASILAKNWSAYTANTAVATTAAGRESWPDYWSVDRAFDANTGELTVTGSFIDLPLAYRRRYRFEDGRIRCEWGFTASGPLKLRRLVCCFPYPAAKSGPTRVVPLGQDGGQWAGFRITDDTGKGHTVRFASPRAAEAGRNRSVDHYGKAREYGRVLVEIPPDLPPGRQRVLRYEIVPTPTPHQQ